MWVTFIDGPLDGQTHNLPDGMQYWNAAPKLESVAEPFSESGILPFNEIVKYVEYRIVKSENGRNFLGIVNET